MNMTEIERALRQLRLSGIAETLSTRVKAWLAATSASQQLVDEWAAWLERPDISVVKAL